MWYLSVAEVLVRLATDTTFYLSRRGGAHKVNKLTFTIRAPVPHGTLGSQGALCFLASTPESSLIPPVGRGTCGIDGLVVSRLGLGFRIYGLGFTIEGIRFRVEVSGFRVDDSYMPPAGEGNWCGVQRLGSAHTFMP